MDADVKVLVQGTWMEFSKSQLDGEVDHPAARSHGAGTGAIAAGPVTVPAPATSGEYHLLTAEPY